MNTQSAVAESVPFTEALDAADAGALLDWLTANRPLASNVRQTVLELLEGHPLALTWAGNLLARDEEDPARLAEDWKSQHLPRLSDPKQAERTLYWLFARSVRGLDNTAGQALAAGDCWPTRRLRSRQSKRRWTRQTPVTATERSRVRRSRILCSAAYCGVRIATTGSSPTRLVIASPGMRTAPTEACGSG